jgi:hypothetical protein
MMNEEGLEMCEWTAKRKWNTLTAMIPAGTVKSVTYHYFEPIDVFSSMFT